MITACCVRRSMLISLSPPSPDAIPDKSTVPSSLLLSLLISMVAVELYFFGDTSTNKAERASPNANAKRTMPFRLLRIETMSRSSRSLFGTNPILGEADLGGAGRDGHVRLVDMFTAFLSCYSIL